jgi:hypothetical protein
VYGIDADVGVALSLHSGDLALISLLNALVSGSDAIAAALVQLHVPANAVVRGDPDPGSGRCVDQ